MKTKDHVMNFIRILIGLLLLAQSMAFAAKLQVLQSTDSVTIDNVEIVGLVKGSEVPSNLMSGSAIYLKIRISHYCSETVLQEYAENRTRIVYKDLAEGSGFPGAACEDEIDFFWAPQAKNLIAGSREIATLKIGQFVVKSTIQVKKGKDPNSNSIGFYFEYTKVSINETQKPITKPAYR